MLRPQIDGLPTDNDRITLRHDVEKVCNLVWREVLLIVQVQYVRVELLQTPLSNCYDAKFVNRKRRKKAVGAREICPTDLTRVQTQSIKLATRLLS